MMSTLKLFAFGAVTCLVLGCSSQKNQSGSDNQRPGARAGGAPDFAQMLEQMDANKDGKLAQAEVSGPLKQDFKKIDTDGDGFISKAELEKAPRPHLPPAGRR